MLDPGNLEAPGLDLLAALAADLVLALAPVTRAFAAQQRVVGVDVPAGRAGKGQIVDGDPLDFALDGDEQGADVGRQLEVRDLVGRRHQLRLLLLTVQLTVLELLLLLAGVGDGL